MPPSQWVKLLQYKRLRGTASTSCRIVAPVVVKPETVSNSALKKLGTSPEKINGSAPKTEMMIQESAVMT